MSDSAKQPIDDAQENRAIAAIGYLGILCLVPLLLAKDSPFARFHGKQGLVLLIALILLWAGIAVPPIGPVVWLFGSLALFCLMILGMVNAYNGKQWEMPVLGKFAKTIKL
ncbi:hypothetical protein EPO34_02530 [Patescibacteria group bacterium]|nr:MAG: hypothetical protein EPO34_02530 [Patescibacteria group bacterium]